MFIQIFEVTTIKKHTVLHISDATCLANPKIDLLPKNSDKQGLDSYFYDSLQLKMGNGQQEGCKFYEMSATKPSLCIFIILEKAHKF